MDSTSETASTAGVDAPPLSTAPIRRPMSRGLKFALAGSAVAGCAYLALVDPNASGAPYLGCPFRALTGFDCPGCGITRALHALVTGNVPRAFDHNLLLTSALFVGVLWWLVSFVRERTGRAPLRSPSGRWVPFAFGALVVAFWIARNLPWSPFTWLASGAAGV